MRARKRENVKQERGKRKGGKRGRKMGKVNKKKWRKKEN